MRYSPHLIDEASRGLRIEIYAVGQLNKGTAIYWHWDSSDMDVLKGDLTHVFDRKQPVPDRVIPLMNSRTSRVYWLLRGWGAAAGILLVGYYLLQLEGPYDEEFQSKLAACISVFLVGKFDDHSC